MATPRELLNKLNDLYEKIVKYQDMSIISIIPNPGDIIKGYNNYITAKFRYDEKLQSLQMIDKSRINLDGLNKTIFSIKTDRECIARRVKSQRGSGKKIMNQAAGGMFDWFTNKIHPNATDLSIEDKIDILEQQQKILEQTPIKSINVNLREEYNNYVDAIKKYKTILKTANKSSDVGGSNVLGFINEYIETIRQLENLKCSQSASLEYPLIDLERKIGESVKKIRTQTAQISSISPSVKKYMDEIKELNKKLKILDAEKAQLAAKVSKFGIDSMRKSAVSSAVKIGKIKDLLKVQKSADLRPGEKQVIYNSITSEIRDIETGNIIPQRQTSSAVTMTQMTPMNYSNQNFGSASVQLPPGSVTSNINISPGSRGSPLNAVEHSILAQANNISIKDWEDIFAAIKQKELSDQQRYFYSAIDSSYQDTSYYKKLYEDGYDKFPIGDRPKIAAMLLSNGKHTLDSIRKLLIPTLVLSGSADNSGNPSAARESANQQKINRAKDEWQRIVDTDKGEDKISATITNFLNKDNRKNVLELISDRKNRTGWGIFKTKSHIKDAKV